MQQRGKVVGARPDHGILEIEQADLGNARALLKPQQVGRVIVAQHPGLRRLENGAQRIPPQREEQRPCRSWTAARHGGADTI